MTTYRCACVHAASLIAGIPAASSCPTHGEAIVKNARGERSTIANATRRITLGYMTRAELALLLG